MNKHTVHQEVICQWWSCTYLYYYNLYYIENLQQRGQEILTQFSSCCCCCCCILLLYCCIWLYSLYMLWRLTTKSTTHSQVVAVVISQLCVLCCVKSLVLQNYRRLSCILTSCLQIKKLACYVTCTHHSHWFLQQNKTRRTPVLRTFGLCARTFENPSAVHNE